MVLIIPRAAITLTSTRSTVPAQSIAAGGTTTLLNATYKHAIVLIRGDGEPQVQLTVTIGTETYTLTGDQQAIALVANETITIDANNTDTAAAHNAPSIEVLELAW